MSLERLWLAAWLDGLHRAGQPVQSAAVPPAAPPAPRLPTPRTGR